MSVSMRSRGRPIARLGVTPLSGTDGGYPWHDGELLYADDLNAAITASATSVLDLGAKGDGVTDDTLAIQYAMNTYAGKAIVYIPDTGHPYIVNTLSPPSGLSLWLDGTLKLIAAASNSLINFTGQSNITITGHGTLDGNGSAQTTVSPGIAVMNGTCTNLRISGITLTNAHLWNLNLTACANVRLDGINLLGGANANEFAAGCDDCWLLNSLVDGTGNGDYAFAFYGGVTNSGAIGNTIRNAGAGTTATPPGIGILSDGSAGAPTSIQCRNITIADNIIHGCGGPGISCLNVSGGLQSGILISNNRCYQNSQIGSGGVGGSDIFIDTSEDVTVIGNQSSANGNGAATQFTGIFLGPNASKVSVIGNHVYNTGQGSGATASAGLWNFAVPHLYVSGNHFFDTQTTPTMQYSVIGSAGAHTAIAGNFFDRPYNMGAAADTVAANVINGAWAVGTLSGSDVTSVVNASVGHKASLQYQANYLPRWNVGIDGSAEPGSNFGSDFVITSIADNGTPTDILTIRRDVAVVQFAPNTRLSMAAPQVVTNAAGVSRWFAGNVGNAETGSDSGSDFAIYNCHDSGGLSGAVPLGIKRSTGLLQVVVPPSFANDAAAATGGIPVGGIYRTGSALQVRVT